MPDTEDRGSSSDGGTAKGGRSRSGRRSFGSRLPSARQMGFLLFGFLLALAVAFYIWWALAFHVYVDNGMYAVMATLAGFGLAGMWLTVPPKQR